MASNLIDNLRSFVGWNPQPKAADPQADAAARAPEMQRGHAVPTESFERVSGQGTGLPSVAATVAPATPALSALEDPKPVHVDVLRHGKEAQNAALVSTFDRLPGAGGAASVRLLEDNQEAWHARWDTIANAKNSIDTTYFILDHDIFGHAYLGHLLKKAKEGVNVRLMADANGDRWGLKGFKASGRGQDYLQELVETGHADVRIYLPVVMKWMREVGSLFTNTALVASDHDKILVADGQRGIVGGRNISLNYYVDPKDYPEAFRDTDIVANSPAMAKGLKDAFEVEFNRSGMNYTVHGETMGNLVKRDIEMIGAYILMDDWLKAPALSPEEARLLRTDEVARGKVVDDMLTQVRARLPLEGIDRAPSAWDMRNLRKLADELVGYTQMRGSYAGFKPAEQVHNDARTKVLDRTSSEGVGADTLTHGLADLVGNAKHSVVIENPYVVLTEETLKVLEEAGKRGVEITLLTNSPQSTDSALTQAFFVEEWPNVLARVPNMRIFVMSGERKLHAKVAVIDGQVSVHSTYNMDYISAQVNSEVAAVTESRELAADTLASIDADLHNPDNRIREYTIARDEKGTPLFADEKPIVTYGAKNHLSFWQWEMYKGLRRIAKTMEWLPELKSLRNKKAVAPGVEKK